MHTRLLLYTRIASAPDDAALTLLEEEMVCYFGSQPPPAKDLFRVPRIKLRATRGEACGPRSKGGRIVFHPAASIDPVALVRLVQSEPKRYRFEGGERLGITAPLPEGEHRIQALHAVFDRIAAKDKVNPAADRGTCARSSPRCRRSDSVGWLAAQPR